MCAGQRASRKVVMKVAYIIGPFRAPTPWQVEQNVRRAEALALKVAELGVMPLCPHTNTRHFHGLLTEQFWLDGTMELARRSDFAVCVKGWRASEGSRAEVEDFRRRGLPVFYEQFGAWTGKPELDDLREWLEAQPK
jgi:hypothetical protein